MKGLQVVAGVVLLLLTIASGLGFLLYEDKPGGAYGTSYNAGRIAGLCLVAALGVALLKNGLAWEKATKRKPRRNEEEEEDDEDDDRPRRRRRSPGARRRFDEDDED